MTSDFERIKNAVNLQQIILQETHLQMKGHHLAECPFCGGHECFSIKDNQYKCFQCSETGDVFTFLQKFKNLELHESLKYSAGLAGITLKEKKKAEVKLSVKERIFIAAAQYYHSHMLDNGGKQYLMDQRGHNEDVLRKMQVGWTDGGLIEHLRSAKGFDDIEIKASGLTKVREQAGAEHLVDYFVKDVAIFPHIEGIRVLHFTIKDPNKKYKYQLLEKDRFKEWRFYNQTALDKFKEIIAVEGENDLLSVLDADIQNVIGLIGQPADYQIKVLQNYCRQKHLYLWLDNDEGGKNFVRKTCAALKGSNVRVVTYPETFKDPDEYLRKFDGDRKKEIRRLQAESVDYLTWEIKEIGRLETREERLKALKDRKIFVAVADMVEAEKMVYIEKLSALGFTESAIEQQLEVNYDLRNALKIYFERVSKKDADPNEIVSLMFKSLSDTGQFYRDRMADTYLMYQHQTYQIGNNRPFNALIKKLTGLLPTKEPGRSVWESLASEAYTSGKQIDLASWLHTDRINDTVYINFNSPNNIILKISKTGIEEIPNGLNKEGILLKSSKKILPVNFLPDADIKEGITALKELIFDNITTEKEQRYLIICWFISAFLLDFAPYMGLMKFSGPTSSGKTTAARLLSILIYGNDHLGDPSTAAAYAVASQNPLLIIDNLESDDFTKSIFKFLLLSATKGSKEKRTQGTESDTTQEQPKALVLITAIEPFTKAELINRTYDLDFSFKFKTDSFIEDEVIRSLLKKRDLIISSLLKFISRNILADLERRRDFITILKKQHKNHAKNRTDEYIALLMLMLEKLLEYIPYYNKDDFLDGIPGEDEKTIRTAWIDYQNAKAKDTETSSNSIIKLCNGLVREYIEKMKSLPPIAHKNYPENEVFVFTHPEYMIEVIKTKSKTHCSECHKPKEAEQESEICVCNGEQIPEVYSQAIFEFIATSGEIVGAFDKYCRNYGIKNPYETPSIFASRLRNDQHLLAKAGWQLITKEGIEPYFTKIKGERFYKFRKFIVR